MLWAPTLGGVGALDRPDRNAMVRAYVDSDEVALAEVTHRSRSTALRCMATLVAQDVVPVGLPLVLGCLYSVDLP